MISVTKSEFGWVSPDDEGVIRLQQYEALLQMYQAYDIRRLSPLTGGWAMEPVAIWSLLRLMEFVEPNCVLECGSGVSTIWIARALRKIGKGRLVSLEHEERFLSWQREQLLREGSAGQVTLELAPLVPYELRGEEYLWYELGHVPKDKIDILIVDGPPGKLSRFARYPALTLLRERLSPRALIVVDDVDRKNERIMVRDWISESEGLEKICALGPRTQLLQFSS